MGMMNTVGIKMACSILKADVMPKPLTSLKEKEPNL